MNRIKDIFPKISFARSFHSTLSFPLLTSGENVEKKLVACESCNNNVLGKELKGRDVKIEVPKNIFIDKKDKEVVKDVLNGRGMQYQTEYLVKLVRLVEGELISHYHEDGFGDLDKNAVFDAIEVLEKIAILGDKAFLPILAEQVLKRLHKVVRCDDDHFHKAIEESLDKVSKHKKKQLVLGKIHCPVLDELNQKIFMKLYANKLDQVSVSEGKGLLKFIFDNFVKLSNELDDRDKAIFFVTVGRLISHRDDTVRDSAMQFVGRYASAFFRRPDY